MQKAKEHDFSNKRAKTVSCYFVFVLVENRAMRSLSYNYGKSLSNIMFAQNVMSLALKITKK